jgi:chemotaxis protein methyltransferase CheR
MQLEKAQFEKIRQLIYRSVGINLHPGKQELVKARLTKRLRALGLKSVDAYMSYLNHDNPHEELSALVDVMTTNKTHFFREPQHFDYLCRQIVPRLKDSKIRIWSAGCSSGEEPYSIAIVLHERIPDLALWDFRILATDLSNRMLGQAQKGIYGQSCRDVPPLLMSKYFECVGTKPTRRYQIIERLRRQVHFARLNLIGDWPMKGPFDLIFCRNVMIYFDKSTQEQVVNRFWKLLKPEGHLFVGHSESLAGSNHPFRYVQPAVYVK